MSKPLQALDAALEELLTVRFAPLSPQVVLAAAEAWERVAARVCAGRLVMLAALDERDDVIPKARAGQGAVTFAQHVAGQTRAQARRAAQTASLLSARGGDLPRTGTALAAGDISSEHAQVVVRAHRELGAAARELLVPCELAATGLGPAGPAAPATAPDGEGGGAGPEDGPEDAWASALADVLADLAPAGGSDASGRKPLVRQVVLVDAVLAHYARQLTVPELDAVAKRIVTALNPPGPGPGHGRRSLHMSRQFDGTWIGRFEGGDAQGALLKAALSALSAPRPGIGIDADGVEHPLPDLRDLGARQMDALVDLVTASLSRSGMDLSDATARDDPDAAHDPGCRRPDPDTDADSSGVRPAAGDEAPTDADDEDSPEPPPGEGEYRVVRAPGVRAGPLPPVELIVTVGIEHLAAACTPQGRRHDELPLDPDPGLWQGALSPHATPATVEHAGPVHPATLRWLSDCAHLRVALLDPGGAVLNVGRSRRLVTPAQRRALTARDQGCVIPGCTVPADACQAHHVVPWTEGGPTDLDNLALLCIGHHIGITTDDTDTGWQIHMREGVLWARPPSWADPARPLLRNAVHHPRRPRRS